MKFNKWTLGLAAVGVVSLVSAVKAEEKASSVMTALSSTTLSGYVDTSAQWNIGDGQNHYPGYKFGGAGKADGFNLNVVQLRIEKALDESEWAAGYRVDLWAGPDANTLATQSTGLGADFAVRQAYVALRTPVGNGIDWKIGAFDSILGYESVEDPSNPNHTRSYGHSIEPQTHTGILASYRFSDMISASAGIANTIGPAINGRANPPKAQSYKAYMGSLTFTAPSDWGALAGSTLYGGIVNGFSASYGDNQTSWYVGATLATPVTGLRVGAAFDYLDVHNAVTATPGADGDAWSIAGYASYQATEKLSLHARVEYLEDKAYFFYAIPEAQIFAFTATAQYDLWKNVISRVEFRWDRSVGGDNLFGGVTSVSPANRKDAYLLAANIIYKF
jgi:hypothetical protein